MSVTVNDPAAWPAEQTGVPHTESLTITLEVVLYLALALLALVLHTAQLGAAPLNDAEAREGLAALRVVDNQVPGEAPVSRSPLTFALHVVSFTFLGHNEASARFPVALGGVLLALSPALWRCYLNPLPPLIISLILTLSPVVLLASRTLSPVVWTMLLAVILPWLVLRFMETRRRAYALSATAACGAMIFLADPAGLLTLLALAFGVFFAWLTEDDPDSDVAGRARDLVRVWPWMDGLIVAGLVLVLVGTVFFWWPEGLTVVGNTAWVGARGFVERLRGAPLAFPLWISLRYEFGLLIFGLIASYRALREGSFFERALVGWFLLGLVWSLGYAGADAANALWLTVPLSVLVGLAVTNWLVERPGVMWQVPVWGVPLHVAVTLALWLALGLSVVILGKLLLLDLPADLNSLGDLTRTLFEGVYSRNAAPGEVVSVGNSQVFVTVLGNIQLRVLWVVLIALLIGVVFFLVGSIWGARTSWRGLALGTLAFFLLFSAGLGGRAAFKSWSDPRELWYVNPVTNDVFDLRATLREMSLRATGTPHLIDITAQVPEDGSLAWALRGFPNTTFVDGVGPETQTAAVVMPVTFPQPRMGADYVGKELVIRRSWDMENLFWRDILGWVYRSDSVVKPLPDETIRLWVRKDVYGVERVTEE
jgi:hypothetical protein